MVSWSTQLTTKDNVLTLRLVNTQVNVKNNARDLDLRYFKTPVRSVKVKRKGKDTLVTIVLKRAATPRLETVDGKAGYKLVVLAFGAGEAEAAAKSP